MKLFNDSFVPESGFQDISPVPDLPDDVLVEIPDWDRIGDGLPQRLPDDSGMGILGWEVIGDGLPLVLPDDSTLSPYEKEDLGSVHEQDSRDDIDEQAGSGQLPHGILYNTSSTDTDKTKRVAHDDAKKDSRDNMKDSVSKGKADDAKKQDAQDDTDKQMEPPVRIFFKCPDSCDKDEFNRQVKGQEDGLNNLTIGEFLRNRKRYEENKRDTKEAPGAQQRAREEARADKIAELRKGGMSREDAENAADKWLETQDALHDPDQVAGGNPNHVTGMGDKNVNRSIGGQWDTRAKQLKAAVEAYIEENHIPEEEWDNIKMNVNLNVE